MHLSEVAAAGTAGPREQPPPGAAPRMEVYPEPRGICGGRELVKKFTNFLPQKFSPNKVRHDHPSLMPTADTSSASGSLGHC